MKHRYSFLFLLLLLPTFVFANTAQPLDVSVFSRGAEYFDAKLSPKGDYLSIRSKVNGKNTLGVIDLKAFKLINAVRFETNAQVGSYHWVSEDRIVLEKEYIKGWQDFPSYHGELFGIDADGGNGRYLVGYQGEQQVGSRLKKATPLMGTSYVLDPLVDDPKNMLIVTYPWSGSTEPYVQVYKVDVKRGTRRKVTRAPVRDARYLTDHDGYVRFAVSSSDYIDQNVYIRSKKDKEWSTFDLENQGISHLRLHGLDNSGQYLYASGSKNEAPKGLYKIHIESKKVELVHQDEVVDPSKVWIDDGTKELFAVEYEAGYPTYVFLDKQATMTKRLRSLLATFEGEQVRIVSSTRDGSVSIVKTLSDTNPGSYYLYDGNKNKLSFLFSSRSWINKDLMAESKPINFKSRDGKTIYGYLTLPSNREHKNLPLVVMPHGGPHGPRDWWEWDADAQLLANRGIAVLKVNFRGSGGFGPGFEFLGHQRWGSAIQHDIIDGVNFVVEQGYVNKDNMCIMGASFGGYSALQSAIIEPDLFKCAIGVVGVYNLPMMFTEGDIADRDSGQRYLTEVLGKDEAKLKAYSPSYNVEKLKAPVLIVHGGEDERAPIEQAESIIDALKKANHPHQYMLLENEGHGFYKPEHRAKYYNNVLAFLDKHLTL